MISLHLSPVRRLVNRKSLKMGVGSSGADRANCPHAPECPLIEHTTYQTTGRVYPIAVP